mmetsp:Transcript_23603/g.52312  ORF Transcript_23603/g.52312 Transcript_23603/m.52312 type:complete len:411 (-) Transcript_23603:104-1336(-)|eukprot:CAMPEP_0170582662 /NCGR_PEP_ID=MMETSP0224-20130122/7708_1 /TAXON_ID=285029 /ORGANISM="Togula jolla, Strain CCCM 725" /LENGTH=410 /DNA_ID=CAMNT_0010905911 /DNA_START=51 /DNA_END=1283 /DNA_ORIENTATION=+
MKHAASAEWEEGMMPTKQQGLLFLAAVTCGLVNNLTYCLISGASQNLGRHFGVPDRIPLVTTSMNAASLVGVLFITRFMLGLSSYLRMLITCSLTAVAYMTAAFASNQNSPGGFDLFLVAAVTGSFAGILGEVTVLSFLKGFPSQLLGGWGAGTGIAGILGGGLYVFLGSYIGLTDPIIFLLTMLILPLYLVAFHFLHMQGHMLLPSTNAPDASHALTQERGRAEMSEPATYKNVMRVLSCAGGIIFNLAAVYYFEYSIYPGLIDRETMHSSKYWYTVMWMSYNIGVTMSRLSIAFFRIDQVWKLTLLQAANAVLWVLEVYSGKIRYSLPAEHGMIVLAVWMVGVGLCGGASYSNCVMLINTSEEIPNNLRELGLGLMFFLNMCAVVIATFSFSIFNETVLSESTLYPVS